MSEMTTLASFVGREPIARVDYPSGEEVLDAAAKALEEKGWTQGAMIADDGSLCAIGSLLVGAKHVRCPGFFAAVHAVEAQVKMEVGTQDIGIANWNDAPERTVEDVLLILKRAKEA